MSLPDDTKPRSPFTDQPVHHGPLIPPPDDDAVDAGRQGPGCVFWGIFGAAALGFAVLIVALAGAAGWTSGSRTAQISMTATQNALVSEQLNFIPNDIASGNTVMLRARVDYLATLGVPNIPELAATATALFDSVQPTITPTPEPTSEATPTQTVEAVATQEPLVVPTLQTAGGGFDPAPVLAQAQTAMQGAQYQDAIDLLDTVIRIDPNYETSTVRSLMLDAMTTRALNLYRSGTNLAEAVLLTDRALDFGLSNQSDLLYEQYIATLYLNATSAIGTNYSAAISALREIYTANPNYADVGQLLFQQYIGYGDAFVAGGDHCSAVGQYQNALNLFVDGGVTAKRDNAQQICEQGTPIPPGAGLDGSPIAPIGVPGS